MSDLNDLLSSAKLSAPMSPSNNSVDKFDDLLDINDLKSGSKVKLESVSYRQFRLINSDDYESFPWSRLKEEISKKVTSYYINLIIDCKLPDDCTGLFKGCDIRSLRFGDNAETANVKKADEMFKDCEMLTLAEIGLNLRYCESMSAMFQGCTQLSKVWIGGLNCLKDASSMFSGCTELIDVSIKGDETIVDIHSIFSNCRNLRYADIKLSNEVKDISYACYRCESLVYVPFTTKSMTVNNRRPNIHADYLVKTLNLYLPEVTSMESTFEGCYSLAYVPDIIGTSNLKTTVRTFKDCRSLRDVYIEDISNVVEMSSMFEGCISLESMDTKHWDTKNVRMMDRIFSLDINLKNIDISNWSLESMRSVVRAFALCPLSEQTNFDNWSAAEDIPHEGMLSLKFKGKYPDWYNISTRYFLRDSQTEILKTDSPYDVSYFK